MVVVVGVCFFNFLVSCVCGVLLSCVGGLFVVACGLDREFRLGVA